MAIKKFKPTTPGQRFKEISSNDELTPGAKPEKSLLKPMKKSGGRNNAGKMTMRYMGGGHKKRYRLIDFKRDKDNIEATVKSIEYDPNRSARIALVVYADGEKRYILAPEKLEVGQKIISGEKVAPEMGNTLPLANIPLGTDVHNIELKPGKGGMLARSGSRPGEQRESSTVALEGTSSARKWCSQEPGGSPHGWWRRPCFGRTPQVKERDACQRV